MDLKLKPERFEYTFWIHLIPKAYLIKLNS